MSAGFSFGTGAGGASKPPTQGLFGTAGTPTTGSIFGGGSTSTTQPAGNLFGSGGNSGANTTNPPSSQSGLFGQKAGTNPPSGASTPTPFGANASTGNAPSSGPGLFGGVPSTASSSSPFGASTGGGFSFDGLGGSTPAKPATTQAGGLFGQAASTTAPAGSTTPAPSKTFSLLNSTTPAGPPPAGGQTATGLFGSTTQQPTSTLFGAKPAGSAQANPGGLFNNLGAAPSGGGGLCSGTAPTGGLFNITSTPASSAATTSSTTAPASSSSAFSFPTASSAPVTQATKAPAGGLFGPPTTAAPKTGGLFPNLGGGVSTTTSSNPAISASTTKPMFGGGLGSSTPAGTSAAPTTTAPASTSNFFSQPLPPTTTAPAGTSNLFNQTLPASSSTLPLPTTTTSGPGNDANTKPAGPDSVPGPDPNQRKESTSGPVPQQSRLKNKTMDEIITRWASDLLKYQKDFQEQASKVADWDRMLVENGDKIQTLYNATCEAERSTKEIESQLSTVENQQAELTSWLDRYEGDVDGMFTRQVGGGENLQGPDQERERTYKIAEKLTYRLDEMGKNITSMIEAINDASTSVSKNVKADDPLSHIVRVLNSHLTQLQWIDQNTEVLQAKVAAAQKIGQNLTANDSGGPNDDAAEAFLRSYNSRR